MKKPKTPFRSALRGQIRKTLSIVGRNRQSRLNPTTRQQCYDIFALALVIVIIVSIVVLLVQNLVSFPQIFFRELSGFCAFLAPSVRDHLSRLSPDNFIFLIPLACGLGCLALGRLIRQVCAFMRNGPTNQVSDVKTASARCTPAPGMPRKRGSDHSQNEKRPNGDVEVPGGEIQDRAGDIEVAHTQDEPSRQPQQNNGKSHKKNTKKKRRGRK